MSVIAGFILSIQTQQRRDGIRYVLWLASDNGPVKVVTDAQQAVFFVLERSASQVKSLLHNQGIDVQISAVTLKNFAEQQMCACYFNKLQDYYAARDALRDAHIAVYEDDIRPQDQFLMERFIRGAVWVKGQYSPGHSDFMQGAQIKPNEHFKPTLTALSLDIECSGDGILYSFAVHSDSYTKVVMVGNQQQSSPSWLEFVPDEVALLLRLNDIICDQDPDLIIGWNVVDFDFQLLCFRAKQLNVNLNFGRNKESVIWRGGQINKLVVPGRAVLDGIEMLKNATYHFTSFSLDNVAHEMLGERKLIDGGDKLGQIQHLFEHDKVKLAQYNRKDAALVLEIFRKLELVDFAVARTRLTGLPLERLGGSVAAFTNLYLPHLHRSGYVAPNLGEHGLHFDSPGGYVMESTPGLYQNVAVLDFKSLYPSIIRTFRIDPLGLIAGLADKENSIEGFNGGYFSRTQHHLPQLVATLWEARQAAKDEGDHHLQQAIKIIMNSLYGVLGSTGCRFYDPRLSSSITLRGHEIMQTTKLWLEEMGVQVIYGDTDSTFVSLPENLSLEESHTLCVNLVGKINQKWAEKLSQESNLCSFMELEYESLFRPFFMPKARHKDIGSKKRYAGLLAQKDFKLVFKGMESVRSDWTPLARDFQQALFRALFNDADINAVVQHYVNETQDISDLNKFVYAKRLGKKPEQYVKTIPPHVRATLKSSKQFHKGDWIEYVQTVNGPELMPTNTPLDIQHYMEKQLQPIIDDLSGIGISVEAVSFDGQFSLI
ncbi:DNA polymerase II [Pseudoalteromonas sp. SSDWG2]|uniref:DNA polymerase II n=1 Tax=Pseudoalteromonas sp. SSDWG2 TaxID=3139391 RepID=UPI003BAC9518